MGADHSQNVFEEMNSTIVPAFDLNMQSFHPHTDLKGQSKPRGSARLSHDNRRPFEETDSEDDRHVLRDIDSLPPSLSAPRLPQRDTARGEPVELQNALSNISVKRESVPFVPTGDIPRYRTKDSRFNHIRSSSKVDDARTRAQLSESFSSNRDRSRAQPRPSRMYSLSVADSSGEAEKKSDPSASSSHLNTRPCSECRRKKQHCSHNEHTTGPSSSASRSSTVRTPSRHSKGVLRSAGRTKKDGTIYKKTPHDRSRGLSMTPSAVDYRERKVVQAQYQARLAELLDSDIVRQVEAEGGITPDGRLYKAAVRMMERMMDERADRPKSEPKNEKAVFRPGADETQQLRERATQAEEKLAVFKKALQEIMAD